MNIKRWVKVDPKELPAAPPLFCGMLVRAQHSPCVSQGAQTFSSNACNDIHNKNIIINEALNIIVKGIARHVALTAELFPCKPVY